MGTRQRIALGTLYLMLLFAPLPMLLSLLPGGSAASNANSARDRMTLQIQAEVDEALPHLTPKALVDDLQATGEARAEAADPARLQHARERLGLAPGQPWPAALDTVFEISNGIQAVGLAPLEDIRPLSESPAAQALLAIAARGGELLVWLESSEQPYALSVERLQRWWLVGGLGEEQLYLVDPGKEPLIPGHRFIDLFIEAPIAHRDALTWLQGWWRDQSVAERWEEHLEQRKVRLREAYAGLDSAELLQRIERPGLLQRLLRRDLPRPAGADPRCLTDLETRIGRQLPAAYRAALTRHDGFPELFMLPCATVAQPGDGMSMTSAPNIARRFAVVDEPARATLEVSSATLRQCWTIAGVADVPATPHDSQRGEVSATSNVYPFWLWCPDLHGQFIDLHQNRAHARFDSLLLEAVTAYNAARE